MSENTVITLARALQGSHGPEADFARLFSGLQDTIEKEYLGKIRAAAHEEKAFATAHPPREVTLLRALSAYMDDGGRQQIDRMTHSLLFLHTLQHVQRSVQDLSVGNLLETRSADAAPGETPPSAHSARMAGLLLTLALAESF